jgi:hypothetical protein
VLVPPVPLRPRSVPEIIDASVSLLRQHYIELVTATALFTIPWLLLGLMQGNPFLVQPNLQTAPFTLPLAPRAMPTMLLPLLVVSLILGPLATATTVVIVSDNYLGREVTIASAVARAFGRIITVGITGILQGLAIGLGFILLIIPGFFCIAWFFSAVNVVMVEGKGPMEALSRAHFLAKGSVGRILGTGILCLIIVLVVEVVIRLILVAALGVVHVGGTPAALIGSLGSIFVAPLMTVAMTVMYFDLRIRKEGLDLEMMAKELGVASPNAVPA